MISGTLTILCQNWSHNYNHQHGHKGHGNEKLHHTSSGLSALIGMFALSAQGRPKNVLFWEPSQWIADFLELRKVAIDWE
jgi:hypothetical protein